jgi:hypothetical protein
VETVDLAAIIAKNSISHIEILKIDCEGCEYDALPHLEDAGILDIVRHGTGEIHPRCAMDNTCADIRIDQLDLVTSITCSRFDWGVPWGKCCKNMKRKATSELCHSLACMQAACPSLIHAGHLKGLELVS